MTTAVAVLSSPMVTSITSPTARSDRLASVVPLWLSLVMAAPDRSTVVVSSPVVKVLPGAGPCPSEGGAFWPEGGVLLPFWASVLDELSPVPWVLLSPSALSPLGCVLSWLGGSPGWFSVSSPS